MEMEAKEASSNTRITTQFFDDDFPNDKENTWACSEIEIRPQLSIRV